MKYDDFAQLCDREWAADPPFGDVTALSLTDASLAEFYRTAPECLFITDDDGHVAAGALAAANPVTRSVVRVTGGAEADTATVSYGNADWSPPPRTVTLA